MRPIRFCTCPILTLCMSMAIGASQIHSAEQRGASDKTVEGNWLGKLGEIRVVFRIARTPDGKLEGFNDSPDQDAWDMPVEVSVKNGDVRFFVKPLGVAYEGSIKDNETIDGGLKLRDGQVLPLQLKRIEKPPARAYKRPQEPKKPYPYKEENVVFENSKAGIKLAGTLTLPKSGGPFPAVLLIPGSGPNDRDELIWGHRVFLVLADHLTRHGIAVLRADDRGAGESTGDFSKATLADFADDARAGVDYLKSRKEVNRKQIGLVGHSAGGLIGPLAAAGNPDVAFVVLMAAPAMQGQEGLYLQCERIYKANGATDEAIALNRQILEDLFAIVKREKDDKVAEAKLRDYLDKEARPRLAKLSADERRKINFESVDDVNVGWYFSAPTRFGLTYDPGATLRKLKCPVLAITGAKDRQSPAEQNLKAIEEALKAGGNRNCEVKELPNLNHLFQTCETGAVSEYAKIEETIAPVALDKIANWIGEQAGLK